MSYQEDYENLIGLDPKFKKSITKTNDFALIDLQKCDQYEVFKLEAYLEGVHFFRNEDKTRTIEMCWECTAGVNIFEFMTVKDLLDIDTGKGFIQISAHS